MTDGSILSPLVDKLTSDPATWKDASLLSVTQITPSGLSLLFQVSKEMKTLVRECGGDNRLAHRVLATVFYEASTRTSCSFQAAMQRLGGSILHVDGKGNSSAGKKGESLSDTIRCIECYSDVTVLRHSLTGSVEQVVASSHKPVLNAGDGTGEHPTQALLDLFTICNELNISLDDLQQEQQPLTVVLLGDLKHGRTVHSLAKLLARSSLNIQLRYCSPESLQMPDYIQDYVSEYSNVTQQSCFDIQEAIEGANVLYVTRVQRERFDNQDAYNEVKGSYVVDNELMSAAPSDMIVMHPLPRVDEISTSVDSDPRAAYFRQMENGMFVRMALLALVLGKA
jgi:carbamoyl-phosphate synthase/aspartate carbamoyltransferase/dihydroorotase